MFLFKKSRNLLRVNKKGMKWVSPSLEKKVAKEENPTPIVKAPRKSKAVVAEAPVEKISTEE